MGSVWIVGGFEVGALALMEPTLKYHPDVIAVLTLAPIAGLGTVHGRQFGLGGLLPRVTEELEGTLVRSDIVLIVQWHKLLDCETTSRAGAKQDIVSGGSEWKGHRSTDKRYAGIQADSSQEFISTGEFLAPRCRLITSWGCSRSQGYGCSPFKVVRELGF